jgi:hypothetical protein
MSDFYWVLIRHNIICLYVQIKLNTSKSENKIKQIAEKKWPQKQMPQYRTTPTITLIQNYFGKT